jgi:hypothetical protein
MIKNNTNIHTDKIKKTYNSKLLLNLFKIRYMKNFVEREFEEVNGGYLGEDGFYYTPNGSKKIKI